MHYSKLTFYLLFTQRAHKTQRSSHISGESLSIICK